MTSKHGCLNPMYAFGGYIVARIKKTEYHGSRF